MLNKILMMVLGKSIMKDAVVMSVKNNDRNKSVIKEKLGVSSIDEFMKMNIHKQI